MFDPITQSIVSYQKNVPLYEEALAFFKRIKSKYDEQERAYLTETQDMEGAEDHIDMKKISSLISKGSHGKRDRMDRMH